MRYVQHVSRSRISYVAREYWFELLIAAMGIACMIELVVWRDYPGARPRPVVLAVRDRASGATALRASAVSLRRPAAYWIWPAALTFVDGLLITFPDSLNVVGMATAFLLGNLRERRLAAIGLAIVIGSIVTVVYNIPGPQPVSWLIFIPLRFVAGWVAGYALRERAEQAEAEETRAARAERERDAAARVAVAEERSRIARELHDIVAHAVSVMVLQVGAVSAQAPRCARRGPAKRSEASSGRAAWH